MPARPPAGARRGAPHPFPSRAALRRAPHHSPPPNLARRAAPSQMYVVKRDGSKAEVRMDKIINRVKALCGDLWTTLTR